MNPRVLVGLTGLAHRASRAGRSHTAGIITMKRRSWLAATVGLLLIDWQAARADVFVSPAGSDANPAGGRR